jgi:hypothetical protein
LPIRNDSHATSKASREQQTQLTAFLRLPIVVTHPARQGRKSLDTNNCSKAIYGPSRQTCTKATTERRAEEKQTKQTPSFGMSSTAYREQPPPALSTAVDEDYDYGLPPATTPTPTSASAQGWSQVQAYHQQQRTSATQSHAAADGEEALLDLVQLEELHQEAERMKALGNKHMAAQGMSF